MSLATLSRWLVSPPRLLRPREQQTSRFRCDYSATVLRCLQSAIAVTRYHRNSRQRTPKRMKKQIFCDVLNYLLGLRMIKMLADGMTGRPGLTGG